MGDLYKCFNLCLYFLNGKLKSIKKLIQRCSARLVIAVTVNVTDAPLLSHYGYFFK